jgi:hypothetical protein
VLLGSTIEIIVESCVKCTGNNGISEHGEGVTYYLANIDFWSLLGGNLLLSWLLLLDLFLLALLLFLILGTGSSPNWVLWEGVLVHFNDSLEILHFL